MNGNMVCGRTEIRKEVLGHGTWAKDPSEMIYPGRILGVSREGRSRAGERSEKLRTWQAVGLRVGPASGQKHWRLVPSHQMVPGVGRSKRKFPEELSSLGGATSHQEHLLSEQPQQPGWDKQGFRGLGGGGEQFCLELLFRIYGDLLKYSSNACYISFRCT